MLKCWGMKKRVICCGQKLRVFVKKLRVFVKKIACLLRVSFKKLRLFIENCVFLQIYFAQNIDFQLFNFFTANFNTF